MKTVFDPLEMLIPDIIMATKGVLGGGGVRRGGQRWRCVQGLRQ